MSNLFCKAVATLSVPTIQAVALFACASSANPLVCRLARAIKFIADTKSGGDLIEKGVVAGCEWTVKKVGDTIEITISGAKQSIDNTTRELERNIWKLYFQNTDIYLPHFPL